MYPFLPPPSPSPFSFPPFRADLSPRPPPLPRSPPGPPALPGPERFPTFFSPARGYPISNIGHRISYVEYRITIIGYRNTDIGYRSWDIGHRLSIPNIRASAGPILPQHLYGLLPPVFESGSSHLSRRSHGKRALYSLTPPCFPQNRGPG